MTTYRYKGLSANGAVVEGLVEAFDETEAVEKAHESCRVLLCVVPERTGKIRDIANLDVALLFARKAKPKALALLCSQLAIALKAGMPLVASLRIVAENESNKYLKQILKDVADDVHAGNRLADAFAMRGSSLPHLFIETVRVGEESGRLDDCFAHLQTYYQDAATVSNQVANALTYPILLLTVAIVVVNVIMLKAVPVFEECFATLGVKLPLPTRLFIIMSHFLTDHIVPLAATLMAIVGGLVLFGRTDAGRRFFAAVALKFPGIRLVNRMNAAYQFASTLCTTLAAGLPLVQAASITAEVIDNVLIREDVLLATQGVVEGNALGDGLRQSKWFPSLLLEMTAVGEQTAKLEDTLTVVGTYYSKEVSAAVERALRLLEPIIIIVLACIVAFILLCVYLPLFTMYGTV